MDISFVFYSLIGQLKMSEADREEGSLAPCSIGKDAAASKCHVIFYAKKTGFKRFSDFTECDQKLLVLRSEAKLEENSIICFHHEALFLSEYQSMQKKCCNPFKKKNHNVKAGLRMLDNETAAKLCLLKKKEVIDIKPGQKLIIGVIPAPSVTSSGRQYSFPESVLLQINDAFRMMK